MNAPAEYHPRDKKRLEEGGGPELSLLWRLFRHKNVMPWEVYGRSRGYRDLVYAFAIRETESWRKITPPRRGAGAARVSA